VWAHADLVSACEDPQHAIFLSWELHIPGTWDGRNILEEGVELDIPAHGWFFTTTDNATFCGSSQTGREGYQHLPGMTCLTCYNLSS